MKKMTFLFVLKKMRKYDVFCSRSRFLLIKSMNYDLCDLDFRTALIMSLWRKCLSLARSSPLILMKMRVKGGVLWRDLEQTGKFFDFCCNIFANAYFCLTNEIVLPLKAFWDNCMIFWEVLETALLGNDNWESDNFW